MGDRCAVRCGWWSVHAWSGGYVPGRHMQSGGTAPCHASVPVSSSSKTAPLRRESAASVHGGDAKHVSVERHAKLPEKEACKK